MCQRELQRKVAKTWSKDENLPGNAALVMLFMLGFLYLHMEEVHDPEIDVQETENEVQEELESQSSNKSDLTHDCPLSRFLFCLQWVMVN